MRVVCVDDDGEALDSELRICRQHPDVDDAVGFTDARAALEWFDMDHAELLLLSADMPEPGGLALAAKLRTRYPKLAVIVLARDGRFALEAYRVHPFSYLIKPLREEALDAELSALLLSRASVDVPCIFAQTFGDFAVTVNGRAIHFERAKSKELLALLIDRRGGEVTRRTAFTEMWEDREYDSRAQNYFNVVVNSLRETLRRHGVSEIFEMNGGYMRVRPELIDCDLYRYLRGDPDAMADFRGIYLYGYSWAMWSEGY